MVLTRILFNYMVNDIFRLSNLDCHNWQVIQHLQRITYCMIHARSAQRLNTTEPTIELQGERGVLTFTVSTPRGSACSQARVRAPDLLPYRAEV